MKKLTALLIILLLDNIAIASTQQIIQVGTPEQARAHIKMVQEWAKSHPGMPPPLSPEEEYRIFGKDGLPRPGSGVHIMKAGEMHYSTPQITHIKANATLLKSKGYIEKYNQKATTLLMFKKIAAKDYQQHDKLGPHSTHLRKNASDLQMAYDYKGATDVKEIVGFAPINTYINNGWTGAVEFFVPNGHADMCSYEEINIKLTGSAANFAEDIVSHSVNGKVTIVSAEGNDASGYSYQVEWWDEGFRHVLECAHRTFDPSIKKEVIAIATQIDSTI
ncbi:MAG: hypothetical protein NTW08_04850 [Gammaproteobacteria bacterium]|nr:hypothetical protein [Gammaproteobacteria bacterium]